MTRCVVDGCGRTSPIRAKMCPTHQSRVWRARKRHTIVCKHCGQSTQVDRKDRQFCGYPCATAAQRGRVAPNKGKRKPRPLVLYTGPRHEPRRTPHKTGSGLWKACQCKICGTSFLSKQFEATCSDVCRETHFRLCKKMAKDRRRALKHNAFVANVYRKSIFERDGYRCHLCGKSTDSSKPAPHPRAPTVDHVIPLARGGTHEPANCRTACFLCNSTKGDRGGGEQLALAV